MTNDEKYMKRAILEAKKAQKIGEVPVGACIVINEKIIACGYNKKESKGDATCHAEIEAIRKASKKLGDWRLDDASLFVTLEPCVMCAGAISAARIKNVIFGASDESGYMTGSSVLNRNLSNHKTTISGGVLESECKKLIQDFFIAKRKSSKNR